MPALVSAPLPVTAPLIASVVFASVSSVPPGAVSVTARAVVMSAVVWSVPPASVSAPLTAPRLASDAMASVPELTVHGVTVELLPVRVQVFASVLTNWPKPLY